jgi:tetratricopeptide (TPR) repeat protein
MAESTAKPNPLDSALKLHRAGKLAEAEALYRDVLQRDPENDSALHLLGLVASQTNHPEVAVTLIQRAVAVNPRVAGYHNNLGNAMRAAGRMDDAIDAYRKSISIDPTFALAHYNLGDGLLARGATGDLEEAVAANLKAIALKPDYAHAYNNLSIAHRRQGKHDEAIAACRQAIAINPNYCEAFISLGNAMKEQGNLDDAIAAYRQCLRFNPNSPDALNNFGIATAAKGETDEAISLYRRAIELRPDFAKAYDNLGSALAAQSRLEEAIDAYRQALYLEHDFAEALSNMGLALSGLCRFTDAIAAFDRAIELSPDFAEAHINRAMALLVLGDCERGWPEYQWRVQARLLSSNPSPRIAETQWKGEALQGRTIFLHAEQGLGDTIQFLRYVPLVIERGGRVILGCQRELERLLLDLPGIQRVVTPDQPLPDFDLHCPLASLPLAFNTRLNSIPASVPYLNPSTDLIEAWRMRLGPRDGRLRVGIAWAGNPQFKADRTRSMHLSQLAPLAELKNISFFSLQKGAPASQRGMDMIDLGPDLHDFVDTAAVMSLLDLIISTDTSVPHLAGALGRSVWVMLQYSPDWRWLLDREDSPWYPTMRLFRQKSLGDWSGVVARVAEALHQREGQP